VFWLLRRHAWFLAALVLGLVLRVMVTGAYWPALALADSRGYVSAAMRLSPGPVRPLGHAVFLRLLQIFGDSLAVPTTWRPTLRRCADRGWSQLLLALLAGAVTGGLVGLIAFASGWFLLSSALVVGALASAFVVVTSLGSRRRATRVRGTHAAAKRNRPGS
jgi:hypothetical protein